MERLREETSVNRRVWGTRLLVCGLATSICSAALPASGQGAACTYGRVAADKYDRAGSNGGEESHPLRVSGACPFDFAFPVGFYGLYTKLDSGQPWEAAARERTGNHADVLVRLGASGQLVFWRGTSYLPFWKTDSGQWSLPELVARSGDGTADMPDRINRYSHVRLIENTTARVVVHWRYMPDFDNVDWDGVVDELFSVTPDGLVTREVRQGTEKIRDWEDPQNVTVQQLQLRPGGIDEVSFTPGTPQNAPDPAIAGNPVLGPPVGSPVADWKLDDGLAPSHDTTTESVSGTACVIGGPRSLWRAGVSGTALQCDGQRGGVSLPAGDAPTLPGSMTVEAWIAPGSLPELDWAPVVHQSDWGASGYYLGVDPAGKLGFHASIGGQWRSLVDATSLGMRRWHHVAATHDATAGRMTLYVDGHERASLDVPAASIAQVGADVLLCRNSLAMPPVPGRIATGTWPTWYGFDGLIDEVRIHAAALSAGELSQSFAEFSPGAAVSANPDLPLRRLPLEAHPQGAASPAFGASYTHLEYHDAWDDLWRVGDYPDVLVRFDEAPVRMAFWRGTSYGPALVTENGRWVGEQSSENYTDPDEDVSEGSLEHMSDKQTRHSHVRIVENTPARVVVHWRYGLVDSRYIFTEVDPATGWADWADEYWTIYPDGVAARYLERGKIWNGSWTETLVFNQPGEYPEDNLETAAYTVVRTNGAERTYSWSPTPPVIRNEPRPAVGRVNTKSLFKYFSILPARSTMYVYEWDDSGGSSQFSWYNHFPVSQIVSAGWDALLPVHPTSTSLVAAIPGWKDYVLYGMTDQPASSLLPLRRSWSKPPKLKDLTGGTALGYDKAQRAFLVSLAGGSSSLSFLLSGSPTSPIVNPCLVVRNWASDQPATLMVDGASRPSGADFRQGIVRDIDGSQSLIVWLRENAVGPRSFRISR